MSEEPRPEWEKTTLAKKRVSESKLYEEKGFFRKESFFRGKHVIGRDKPINGGISLGEGPWEAIVVDDKNDPPLKRAYDELVRRRNEHVNLGGDFKDGVIGEVWYLVGEIMPYDSERVDKITRGLTEPDQEVNLSRYIGGGECKQ